MREFGPRSLTTSSFQFDFRQQVVSILGLSECNDFGHFQILVYINVPIIFPYLEFIPSSDWWAIVEFPTLMKKINN